MHLARYGLAAFVFALAACQAAPAPPPSVAKAAAALAAEALEKGDYVKAADLYRSALAVEPESLPLHYGLGVAASYLDRRPEAVREFTWVLDRGETNSAEVKTARLWLLSVGALPRPALTRTVLDDDRDPGPKPGEQKPAPASVQGRVVFAPGETRRERMALFLYDYPNRVVYFRMRTDEEGRFRFANVPPGIYKLTDRAAGPPQWRLKVELKPGQDLTMDLDLANSTRFRDDFPESTQAVAPRS